MKAIPDSGASLSVISKRIAEKLGLKINYQKEKELRALGNNIKVVGVVEQAPITIATAKIPIDLRVVDSEDNTLLLGMDWFNKYEVTLQTKDKKLIFTSEGDRFQTMVECEKMDRKIFYVTETDEQGTEIKVITETDWEEEAWGMPLMD
jgi:hypothetical protein